MLLLFTIVLLLHSIESHFQNILLLDTIHRQLNAFLKKLISSLLLLLHLVLFIYRK